MTWNRCVKIIGVATTGMLLLAALTPLTNVASEWLSVPPDQRHASAIVVLGAGIMQDGTLTQESVQRLVRGVLLYKAGMAPVLIVSGPPHESRLPEADVRAELAIQFGVPAAKILRIVDVNTTREEALRTAELLRSQEIGKTILLVSEPLHLRRAKAVFEASGVTVFPVPSDNLPRIARSGTERILLLKSLVLQSAGLLYYEIAGFI